MIVWTAYACLHYQTCDWEERPFGMRMVEQAWCIALYYPAAPPTSMLALRTHTHTHTHTDREREMHTHRHRHTHATCFVTL